MSKEIKFRGRKIDNDEWIYGYLYTGFIGSLIIPVDTIEPYGCEYEYGINGCFDVYPDTVGQFTGLTDKNGVEIYEGDILKITNIDEEESWLSKVYFEGGALAVDVNGEDYDYTVIGWIKDYIELKVIGNIHQHSNLLELPK